VFRLFRSGGELAAAGNLHGVMRRLVLPRSRRERRWPVGLAPDRPEYGALRREPDLLSEVLAGLASRDLAESGRPEEPTHLHPRLLASPALHERHARPQG